MPQLILEQVAEAEATQQVVVELEALELLLLGIR
jgi:hypothetical protein